MVIPKFFYWLVTFFIDTGLGNGFRNKFAEAKVLGNFKDTQAFVRPAYYFISGVSLFLVVVYFIVNQFIDWLQLFNANASLQGKTSFLLPIIFTFFYLFLPSIGSKINYEYLFGKQKSFHRRKNSIFWVGIVILDYLSFDKNGSKFFTHFWKYFFGLAGINFSWTDFFCI